MTPDEFVKKWSAIQQNERAAAQSHFNDVCALVGHLTPLEFDLTGQNFSFETQTVKPGGTKGFADVYFRDHFIWEYKGPHKDLQKAYNQLLLYRESLGNPPLLIVSDIHRIIIYTNFTNRPTYKYEIGFDELQNGTGVELLKRVFFNPESFEPEPTKEQITYARAQTFLKVADVLREHQQITGESYTPEQLAHFLARLLFCLFVEDIGLLPEETFRDIIKSVFHNKIKIDFQTGLRNLFKTMSTGGVFAYYQIYWFNGSLFDDEFVPTIPPDLMKELYFAANHNWSAIEPSIFGTIFERVIDESKRAQLGAHYTSQADIELIVEPVLMAPLREKWEQIQQQLRVMLLGQPHEKIKEQAYQKLVTFSQEIAQIKVLDPACGSGNFLYVALRHLLDLQKDVIAYAQRRNLPVPPLTVSPQQMFGLEINPYAHELAQITVWIGYLQWRMENGFSEIEEPILKSLNNIQCMDAILGFDAEGKPIEPEWPAVDVIIGNPPFLGAKKILGELGAIYVSNLRHTYKNKLPHFSDLVTYWFEKSRGQIEKNKAQRACLIATNSISMGTNLPVLKRIKESGDIFYAWDDRSWILNGASVRVAIIGFDDGKTSTKFLNNKVVPNINHDLTAGLNLTLAVNLQENLNIAFIGTQKSGPFEIPQQLAYEFIEAKNPNLANNSDVIRPWVNGADLVRRPKNLYVIYFPVTFLEQDAQEYEIPYQYTKNQIKPHRQANHFKNYPFWLHWRPRPALFNAIKNLNRYIITPRVSKHRIFVFIDKNVVPDSATVAIAREDDYFLGVLQSKAHEYWALRMGTSLEDRPRYTPTTTFETFPFPWVPGREPAADPHYQAISQWAKTLHEWREKWLNPPPPNGTKTVDPNFEKLLKQRTITNLYNALGYYQQSQKEKNFTLAGLQKAGNKAVTLNDMEEFATIHQQLDTAVLAAYGLPGTADEDEILDCLLALNAQRAEENGEIIGNGEEDEEEELDID